MLLERYFMPFRILKLLKLFSNNFLKKKVWENSRICHNWLGVSKVYHELNHNVNHKNDCELLFLQYTVNYIHSLTKTIHIIHIHNDK